MKWIPILLLLSLQAPQEPAKKRFTLTLDAEKKITMEFVLIPAGTFTMGDSEGDEDEKPVLVKLTKDFWLQTTETTNAQWKAVMGDIPSDRKDLDLPVQCVSWDKCQEFLKKLNDKAKDQLKELKAALPTEAQWEYACRAGSNGRWCFGDGEKQLVEFAWYGDVGPYGMQPVGKKKPNNWGLFDMHGNMFEWCEDAYGPYPATGATDPVGKSDDSLKVLRGGCWLSETKYTHSGTRFSTSQANIWGHDGDAFYGLRAALR